MCRQLPKKVFDDRIVEIKRVAPQAYSTKRCQFNQIEVRTSGCIDPIHGDGLSQRSNKAITVVVRKAQQKDKDFIGRAKQTGFRCQ